MVGQVIVFSGFCRMTDCLTLCMYALHLPTCMQTSLALSWCLYSLAVNPQVQERLRREVREVTGSSDVVTPAHISDMHYMKLCIKETLRYCNQFALEFCPWDYQILLRLSVEGPSQGCKEHPLLSLH